MARSRGKSGAARTGLVRQRQRDAGPEPKSEVALASGPSKWTEIAQVVTALVSIASATFVGLGLINTNKQINAQQRTTERGQEADRFSKAIEQLGSTSSDVRFGAIYALGSLLRDKSPDTDAIIEVLSAYVRAHAKMMEGNRERPTGRQATNVQAAIDVLVQRPDPEKHRVVNLSGAPLSGASFRNSTLVRLNLEGADLSFTDLRDANLSGAVGLTSQQIRCALINSETILPADVSTQRPDTPTSQSACE